MSPVGTIVATSERRIREISWNRKKIAVTLHSLRQAALIAFGLHCPCIVNQNKQRLSDKRKDSKFNNLKNNKIMTQKNFMSARALNMGELENVNGGIRVFSKPLKKKTFGIRVK